MQPIQPGTRPQRKIDGELHPSPTGLTTVYMHQQVSIHVHIPDGLFLIEDRIPNSQTLSARPEISIAPTDPDRLRQINNFEPGSEHAHNSSHREALHGHGFPADLPGLTRGAVVELNRKDWAVRAGLFQVPNAPNSDVLVFKSGGAVVEFEERHTILDKPGKLRLGIFGNRGNTGNYRQAMAMQDADPTLDINDVMVSIRRDNLKYGFYVNAEQQLINDVGLFARASWNDGQNEILSFTDIDRSVSGGLSVKGSYWGRPSDTVGIGGAINGLSAAHRDFLAAGGNGLLIGDGRLNYGTERIFETYYAYSLNKSFTLTADYQLIINPAYNADRGPVSILSARLHGEI